MSHAFETPRTVLFLHPTPDRYGADVALLSLVRGLDRARWRAVVAVPKDGPLVPLLREAGAEVHHGPLGVMARGALRSPLRLLGLLAELVPAALFVRRLARRTRAAVIHTNTLVVLGGALGARLARVPHVWHLHEIVGRPRIAAALLARLVARLADVVLSNSDQTRRSFDDHAPRLAPKHRVVLNGVDEGRLAASDADRARVRRELGAVDDGPLVALVGRVNAWKGQRLLARAAAQLAPRFPGARFVFVGDPPPGQPGHLAALLQDLRELGLEQRARHVGHRDDVAAIYAAADIVVVPSTAPEPFGLVAAEAMACARPVVAAAHGGLREIVEHGVTGLLVPPGDADSLAAALGELLGDPSRARALGLAGQARQRARFTLARMAADVEAAWCAAAPHTRFDVVHVILGKANPERANGVNQVVHQLAEAQARAGVAVAVFGVSRSSEPSPHPRRYELRVFAGSGRALRVPSGLRRALESLPPETVLHLHGGFVPLFGAVGRMLTRLGRRYVLTPHGAYRTLARRKGALRKRVYTALCERRLLAGASAVHALAEAERSELADLVDTRRVVVVPNGVVLPAPQPPRERAAAPTFVFCGRLSAHTKGLDVLLDGFEAYVRGGGRGRLILIGDGEDRARLAARAAHPGLTGHVEFAGTCFGAQKRELLAGADVFVHPSRHEGMPTAVLEAAALGLPLLVTHQTNLGDAVEAAGAGFVVEAGDARALREALVRADDEHGTGRLAERGQAARRMIAAGFQWARLERELYTELYGLDPAPSTELDRATPERSAA